MVVGVLVTRQSAMTPDVSRW